VVNDSIPTVYDRELERQNDTDELLHRRKEPDDG